MNILISEPDPKYMNAMADYLLEHKIPHDFAVDGRDVQLKVYRSKYDALVLDIETQNHSALEVLKYLCINKPGLKIILTAKSEHRLKRKGLRKDILNRAGIDSAIFKPYEILDLIDSIAGKKNKIDWRSNIKIKETQSEEEDVIDSDDSFTKVPITDFIAGKTAIFDCYIRLRTNHYTKICHSGEVINQERIENYKEKTEFLYFKNSDRQTYIAFMNDISSKLLESEKVSDTVKASATKNLFEKYVEEIYLTGVNAELIEQGKDIVEKIENFVKRNRNLSKIVDQYKELDPNSYSHTFLVTLFSNMIAKDIEWVTPSVMEKINMASVLHDIGMCQLPAELIHIHETDMTEKQLEAYKKHPKLSWKMLNGIKGISEPVRQIVYQHHEVNTGEGFPNGLSATKIYPLAKVLSLSNYFVGQMTRYKTNPMDTLRKIIPDRNEIMKFDPDLVRSLVRGFIEK